MGVAGRNLYIRFQSKSGDAMGMNMISKVSMDRLEQNLKEWLSQEKGNLVSERQKWGADSLSTLFSPVLFILYHMKRVNWLKNFYWKVNIDLVYLIYTWHYICSRSTQKGREESWGLHFKTLSYKLWKLTFSRDLYLRAKLLCIVYLF